jgi:hypothetical protein
MAHLDTQLDTQHVCVIKAPMNCAEFQLVDCGNVPTLAHRQVYSHHPFLS